MDIDLILSLIKTAFASAGGLLGALIGGVDGFLYTLIVVVIIDYITGVANAILKKQLSSSAGAKGIARKIMIFLLVIIGELIDNYIIGKGAVTRTAIIFFYIGNEGISILENAIALGLKVPQRLESVLKQISDQNENDFADKQ